MLSFRVEPFPPNKSKLQFWISTGSILPLISSLLHSLIYPLHFQSHFVFFFLSNFSPVTNLTCWLWWHNHNTFSFYFYAWVVTLMNQCSEVLLYCQINDYFSYVFLILSLAPSSRRLNSKQDSHPSFVSLSGRHRRRFPSTGPTTSTSPSSFIASHQSRHSSLNCWPVTRFSRNPPARCPASWPPSTQTAPSTRVRTPLPLALPELTLGCAV